MRYDHTYSYAVNNNPALKGLQFNTNIERMIWSQALEAKMWDQLLRYKWDRIKLLQTGESLFSHDGEV